MFSIVLLSVLGLTFGQNLPHGHEVKTVVDAAFGRIDHSPTDGSVNQAEYNIIVNRDDTDNDGCVTLAEFEAGRSKMPDGIAVPLYNHLNVEHNDCLNVADLQLDFHLMDHDGNGIVNLHEFEHYYTQLLKHTFGHNTNTHGHQA